MLKVKLLAAAVIPLSAMIAGPATAMPTAASEGEYVSVSGEASRVEDESFWLDYGEGAIKVEVDEGMLDEIDVEDKLKPGVKVTAYGAIDDELFAGKVIEADALYVPSRLTWYDSGGATPVTVTTYYYVADPMPDVSLTGRVASIDGRKFTLSAGSSNITVDTSRLQENPLDSTGYPRLAAGDRVMVSGEFDRNFFDQRVLRADSVFDIGAHVSAIRSATATEPNYGSGSDSASASRENRAEKMIEHRVKTTDAVTGSDITKDGSVGDMANNPVFRAIDNDDSHSISESEWVKFVARPANITKSEAHRLFGAMAGADAMISPMELFDSTTPAERISGRITDRTDD